MLCQVLTYSVVFLRAFVVIRDVDAVEAAMMAQANEIEKQLQSR